MLYQLYYFWIYARLTTPFAEMQWRHKSLKLWKNFLNLWACVTVLNCGFVKGLNTSSFTACYLRPETKATHTHSTRYTQSACACCVWVQATALELHIHRIKQHWLLIAIDLMFMIGKHDEIEPSWADSAQNSDQENNFTAATNKWLTTVSAQTNQASRPSKNTGIDAASAWASKSSIDKPSQYEWTMNNQATALE